MTVVDNRPAPAGFAAARKAMIDSQLRVSGVNAAHVRERMGTVPREDFVPAALRDNAYADRALPLGGGRFLAAPLVHGRMLEEAMPTEADKVLLVDGGSLYLAELLRPLVGSLTVISPEQAAEGGGKGEFSLLVIDGAIGELPGGLAKRLGEGGRVVCGLVERGITRLAAGRKIDGAVSLIPIAEIGMPVLPELAAPKGWSF